MAVDLSKIKTEQRNEKSKNIDLLSTKEMLEIINEEDQKVALAVKEALGQIEKLVDKVVEVFEKGLDRRCSCRSCGHSCCAFASGFVFPVCT